MIQNASSNGLTIWQTHPSTENLSSFSLLAAGLGLGSQYDGDVPKLTDGLASGLTGTAIVF